MAGRPKLDPLTKVLRQAKRIKKKCELSLRLYQQDPLGPVSRNVGRPPVTHGHSTAKLLGDLAHSLKTASELTSDPIRLKDVYDPNSGLHNRVGRPKSTEKERIEYDIRRQIARRDRINNSINKPKATPIGRKKLSNEEKIRRINRRILELKLKLIRIDAGC